MIRQWPLDVRSLQVATLAAALLLMGACSTASDAPEAAESNGDKLGTVQFSRLQVSPESLHFNGSAPEGTFQTQTVQLVTASEVPVTVVRVALRGKGATPYVSQTGFSIESILATSGDEVVHQKAPDTPTKSMVGWAIERVDVAASMHAIDVEVGYLRQQGDAWGAAELVVQSDAYGSPETVVPLLVEPGVPRLTAMPALVDFGWVESPALAEAPVGLTNSGSAPLFIHDMRLEGDAGFVIRVDDWDVELPSGRYRRFPTPIQLQPASSVLATARFSPVSTGLVSARLYVKTNVPGEPEQGEEITLLAESSVPCLRWEPADGLDFGSLLVGDTSSQAALLRNCGANPVAVSGFEVEGQDAEQFSISPAWSWPVLDGTGEPGGSPHMLPAGAAVSIPLTYEPATPGAPLVDGSVVPHLASLAAVTATAITPSPLALHGRADVLHCPVARIEVAQGEEVIPQTWIELDGTTSTSEDGPIVAYHWEVEQPSGGASTLQPNTNDPQVSLQANVVGMYTFRLHVVDSAGHESCEPAFATVASIPDEIIHVQLTWSTPNDPDETDQGAAAGSDVDLHVLHPLATAPGGFDFDKNGVSDGWFDVPYDTFWFNPEPEWASPLGPHTEHPSLDRDDTDGAGPENFNHDDPNLDDADSATTYRVGAHYWDDHQYGPAVATVRVYIYGHLRFEWSDVMLQHLDMWEVCTITWSGSDAVIEPIANEDGGALVLPKYQNPIFN